MLMLKLVKLESSQREALSRTTHFEKCGLISQICRLQSFSILLNLSQLIFLIQSLRVFPQFIVPSLVFYTLLNYYFKVFFNLKAILLIKLLPSWYMSRFKRSCKQYAVSPALSESCIIILAQRKLTI